MNEDATKIKNPRRAKSTQTTSGTTWGELRLLPTPAYMATRVSSGVRANNVDVMVLELGEGFSLEEILSAVRNQLLPSVALAVWEHAGVHVLVRFIGAWAWRHATYLSAGRSRATTHASEALGTPLHSE